MKYSVTITSKNHSQEAPTIRMEWQNRARDGKATFGECLISNGGVYQELNYIPNALIEDQKKDRIKIVKLKIPMVKSIGEKRFWYKDFVWYDTKEEAMKNGMDAVENENTKTLIKALKKHFEVSMKDEKGMESNKNVDPTLMKYDLVDTTERLKKAVEKKVYTIEATSQIYKWFKEDTQRLTTFGYLWGTKNLEAMSVDKLFDYLITEVSNDMPKYNRTIGYINSDIHINVIKASQIIKNGDYIIKKEGNYFMFNGSVLGEGTVIENCIEGVVAYFTANTQDYMLLKNELGIKDSMPNFDLKRHEEEENDGIETKSLSSLNKNPHAQKQENSLKNKFANHIFKIIVEGKDVTSEKKGNIYKFFTETGKDPEIGLKELSKFEEIKDDVKLQEFFWGEVERVRTERTQYIPR